MKQFIFSLEPLMTIRKYREEQAEQLLAEAVGRCVRLEEAIAAREQECARIFSQRYDVANGSLHILSAAEQYADRLRSEADQLAIELDEAEKEREAARQAFQEASRDREILDKLKDKRFREYKRQAVLEETKVLDDLAGVRR